MYMYDDKEKIISKLELDFEVKFTLIRDENLDEKG